MTQRRPSMPTPGPAARTLRLGCVAMAALLACGQPLQAQTGAETPAARVRPRRRPATARRSSRGRR